MDSFGLQVIRHSLLGLKPDLEAALKFADQVEKIIEDVDDEVLNQDIMSGKINYFEMYSKLKTEEQRQAFNEALNVFNLERQNKLKLEGLKVQRKNGNTISKNCKTRGFEFVERVECTML